jgi:Ca-activated chloride channel family protein
MTWPHRRTATLATTAVAAALTLAGCSAGDDGGDTAPSADRGIDASQYVDRYDQSQEHGSSSGAVSSSGAASAGGPAPAASPGPLQDDTFVDHGVSGYVDTKEDPESTFALDVDTGSFSVAKTLLAQGLLPPAASVRAEEWVNSFDYGDPAPEDDALAVRTETGLDPMAADDTTGNGSQLVRVAVSSRAADEEDRPPAHVTLVVDRSGSMDLQSRLGLVKASLAVLANRLRDDDTVAVVSFDDEATPILRPTPVRDTAAILDAVDELQPGGSTNLEAGLRLGYDQARASYDDDAVNVVVLCSDGVANVGDTLPESITDTITEEGAAGIHLVTVGFGMGNYNDDLMEQLADRGDGFYSYVDTFDEAERLFGTELTTTLVPVADEARAQVRFDPELVSSYRLIGYEDRAMADEDFEDLGVDAGELGPGHHATALYAVRLTGSVEPGQEIGSAEVRWADPGDGSAHHATAAVRAATQPSPSDGFELAGAVADAALLVKGVGLDHGVDDARLEALEQRVAELADRDVDGADELLQVLDETRSAQGDGSG